MEVGENKSRGAGVSGSFVGIISALFGFVVSMIRLTSSTGVFARDFSFWTSLSLIRCAKVSLLGIVFPFASTFLDLAGDCGSALAFLGPSTLRLDEIFTVKPSFEDSLIRSAVEDGLS